MNPTPVTPFVAAPNSPTVHAATSELARLTAALHLSDGQLLGMARELTSMCPCAFHSLEDLDANERDELVERLLEIERGVAAL